MKYKQQNKQLRRFIYSSSEVALEPSLNPSNQDFNEFISGFSDGESCFYVQVAKTTRYKTG